VYISSSKVPIKASCQDRDFKYLEAGISFQG
jgi:hypothetical protein